MAKFFRRGISKIYWLPTVAGTNPSASEITAGIDLSPFINAITGFQLTNSPIPTPDLGSVFTKSIPGEDTTAASSLEFYDANETSGGSTAIRLAIAKGTIGKICLMSYGYVTGKRCEIWSVQSTGVNDAWTVANEAAKFIIPFSILDVPSQSSVLP